MEFFDYRISEENMRFSRIDIAKYLEFDSKELVVKAKEDLLEAITKVEDKEKLSRLIIDHQKNVLWKKSRTIDFSRDRIYYDRTAYVHVTSGENGKRSQQLQLVAYSPFNKDNSNVYWNPRLLKVEMRCYGNSINRKYSFGDIYTIYDMRKYLKEVGSINQIYDQIIEKRIGIQLPCSVYKSIEAAYYYMMLYIFYLI